MYLEDLPPDALQRVLFALPVRDRLNVAASSRSLRQSVQQHAPYAGPACEMTPVCAEPSLWDIQTLGQCLKLYWMLLQRLARTAGHPTKTEPCQQTFRRITEFAMNTAEEYHVSLENVSFEYATNNFTEVFYSLEEACAAAADDDEIFPSI